MNAECAIGSSSKTSRTSSAIAPVHSEAGFAGTVVSVLNLNPRKLGSMEDFMACLSRALAARTWRHVLVFAAPPAEPVHSVLEPTGCIIEVAPCSGPRSCLQLARIVWKHRPQVVHFHFLDQFSLLPVLAWFSGANLTVFTEHTRVPRAMSMRARMKMLFFDRIVFRCLRTQIVAISEHIKQTLVENYQTSADRIVVVYNGVNLARFGGSGREQTGPLREEFGIPPESPVIVTAAHFIPEKGVEYLLEGAKRVVAEKPEALFLLVGDGPQSQVLRQQAAELGIQDNVRFTGLRSDVHRLMEMADIVAVPSVWQEPAGLVVIEGMASGRPVVATRVGGIPEYLVDQVTGILVEPRSPEELAAALLRLLNSPAEAQSMGRAGRERAASLFSMERWVSDTLATYAPVMGRSGDRERGER